MDPSDGSRTVDETRPFRTEEFVGAGHSVRELRSGRYEQLCLGYWIRASERDEWSMMRAALAVHPEHAFLSHVSAAKLLGLPVPDPAFVHVTVVRARDRRFRPEFKPHVTGRRRGIIEVRGMRCTDEVATFIDAAGMLGFVDLVVLGDAIVRRGRVSAVHLRRRCRGSSDYYAKLASAAAEWVREGVDSPMESRLRMLIVLAGLPEPVVDYRVYWEDGTLRHRFDLAYPDIGLIIEYDGRQHAEDDAQWARDLDRREQIDDRGWRLLVVTASGVYRHPERTLRRIQRLLVRRGVVTAGELDRGWRDHFAA